jgi:hypothetical protein
MTSLIVKSGICGFIAKIDVEKVDKKKCKVKIITACPMVTEMSNALPEIEMGDIFKKHADSVVYKLAGECHLHTACPVPMAVLKAAEAACELALPCDVMVMFDSMHTLK